MAFEDELGKFERQISEHSEAKRVLEGLEIEQQRQLAALVADTIIEVSEYRRHLRNHRRLRKVTAEATRREKTLKGKLRRAHQRIKELIESANRAGPARERVVRAGLAATRQALEHVRQYTSGLDALLTRSGIVGDTLVQPESVKFPDLGGLLANPVFHPIPKHPVASCMIQLYWFFRYGCGVSGNQSEVRTALLRNAFWTKYDIPSVKFSAVAALVGGGAKGGSFESSGCPAVVEAVRRHRKKITQE